MTNRLRKLAAVCAATLAASLPSSAHVKAIADFLARIGGPEAPALILTELTEAPDSAAESFTITSRDGKPLIKGNSLSAITTGIGWYLNHYANENLTWNRLSTDLSKATLPVPTATETHTSRAEYRYYLNYCTFSYSLSTFTWERWQQEIDWMALHGINMPLQIVGLDVVWRDMLTRDYGYTPEEANKFIAGPCFQAWWGMNNQEGWGGPNPTWWYDRQERLARLIVERERELGIEPVLPGFAGMVPSDFTAKTGINAIDQGGWCGFQRPFILDPTTTDYARVAADYYRHLHDVMGGPSRYYSMDPFHEGGNTSGIDVAKGYHAVYEAMDAANPGVSKWVPQQWQFSPAQWTLVADSIVPHGRMAVLDLYSDGQPRNLGRYNGHDVVWCAIPNFGARTGFFGRFNGMIDGYFDAVATHGNIKGAGAAPEGSEQTPVIYDLIFELPWLAEKPDPAEWMKRYTRSRYGVVDPHAVKAWEDLRLSALDNRTSLQGPHEAVVCARPALDVKTVSTWGGSEIFYDTQRMYDAAFELLAAEIADSENYSYDLADISRQALTDYSQSLLANVRKTHEAGDTALFGISRDRFLGLILDLDRLLGTNANFMTGSWTELARDIADEVSGTTDADREWLEKDNARTLVTTWGPQIPSERGGLRDYSYREREGMLRDFYHKRWATWFANGMKEPEGGWFEMEWDWAHNDTTRYSTTPVGSTAEVAAELLDKYLARFIPASAEASAPVYYIERYTAHAAADKFIDVMTAGEAYAPSIKTGAGTPDIISLSIDGAAIDPALLPQGTYTVTASLTDGTGFTYTLLVK